MINVTKTYLPPLEEYVEYLERIWASNQLTNNGPLVQELEAKLKEFLGIKHLFFVSNGTIALHIAIKTLGLHGEIITTPFSYVATTSSIVWEGFQPVFVDIDPSTLCIDPCLIEQAITHQTVAILATHVYGNPCAAEEILDIGKNHGIPVIFDAAHAFGVKYKGISAAALGDISTLSFHATKLFHTCEGGAIVTDDANAAHTLEYMRRFGHKGQEDFWGLGINGKNSELHAAMGLCVLSRVPEIIEARHVLSDAYDTELNSLYEDGRLCKPVIREGTCYNFSYYSVLFSGENQLLEVRNTLNADGIYPRRYFYPSLNTLAYVDYQDAPVSEDVSRRVLCLPIYHDLTSEQVRSICSIIRRSI